MVGYIQLHICKQGVEDGDYYEIQQATITLDFSLNEKFVVVSF